MPDGKVNAAALLRQVIPTTSDAVALFERVVERVSDRAVVHSVGEGRSRSLYVHARSGDPLVVPWPLLVLCRTEPPEDGPAFDEDPEPIVMEPDEHGHLHFPLEMAGPVPASLTVHDGRAKAYVYYRWDGDAREPGMDRYEDFAEWMPALSRVVNAGLEERLETVAAFIASIDLGRHGPARVLLPRMTPGGVEGTWAGARRALRGAMATRKSPGGSFWAVADGYEGKAITFGPTREAALEAWRAEVARVRPKPPTPPDPDALDPIGAQDWKPREWSPDEPEDPPPGMRSIFRGWDAPPFDPSPSACPGGVVRVAALPSSKPARGVWTRLLGDKGATVFAVKLPTADGFLLVGEPLLPRIDLQTVERRLDAIDVAQRPMDEKVARAKEGVGPLRGEAPLRLRHYECVDRQTDAPTDPVYGGDGGFEPLGFDGALLRTSIVRVRRAE